MSPNGPACAQQATAAQRTGARPTIDVQSNGLTYAQRTTCSPAVLRTPSKRLLPGSLRTSSKRLLPGSLRAGCSFISRAVIALVWGQNMQLFPF